MKKIKLNNISGRSKLLSAYVDEKTIEFINGIAIVKAEFFIKYRYLKKQPKKLYSSYGLINENYEELFGNNPSSIEKLLMFTNQNTQIKRIGNNDFLIIIHFEGYNRDIVKNIHIRLIDGVPTLINLLDDWMETSNKDIIIIGGVTKRLYNIDTDKFITPELSYIKESEKDEGVFDCIATVSSDDAKEPFAIKENLFFKIDSEGKIITPVISSIREAEAALEENIEDLLMHSKQDLNYKVKSAKYLVSSLDESVSLNLQRIKQNRAL